MKYLLDTNVISEIDKAGRCDRHVAAWFNRVAGEELLTSVLVLGELRKGIEKIRSRNPARATDLEAWLAKLSRRFDGRTLAVDAAVADVWGRLAAGRSVPFVDSLIAATALTYGLTLVTRNVADVTGFGIIVLNPFEPPAP